MKDGNNNPEYETAKETLMYRRVLWTLWERESHLDPAIIIKRVSKEQTCFCCSSEILFTKISNGLDLAKPYFNV